MIYKILVWLCALLVKAVYEFLDFIFNGLNRFFEDIEKELKQ